MNYPLMIALASGMSMRRSAKMLKISPTTVARKLVFLGAQAELAQQSFLASLPPVSEMQFDDLHTFEHSKYKPLSVTVAVETKTRKILGVRLSSMAASGLLAKISRKKYGRRPDRRRRALGELLESLVPVLKKDVLIT